MNSSRINILVPGTPLSSPSFHLTSQIPVCSLGKPWKITQFIFRSLDNSFPVRRSQEQILTPVA